ncbi:hypothetical protein ACFRFU_23225 [Streptomyces sp. NPDC056704]|uniref:hypothetical protein n=1 Tax=Streptomyces sp. NPDC056704 TaxID=3345917 RepID=UPI0036CAD138
MFNEDQLSTDGQNYAFSAMQAYLGGDGDLFGLHAGVAVERLAKGRLVRRSPALLVDGLDTAYARQLVAGLVGSTER